MVLHAGVVQHFALCSLTAARCSLPVVCQVDELVQEHWVVEATWRATRRGDAGGGVSG